MLNYVNDNIKPKLKNKNLLPPRFEVNMDVQKICDIDINNNIDINNMGEYKKYIKNTIKNKDENIDIEKLKFKTKLDLEPLLEINYDNINNHKDDLNISLFLYYMCKYYIKSYEYYEDMKPKKK